MLKTNSFCCSAMLCADTGIEWTTAKKEEWKRSALEVYVPACLSTLQIPEALFCHNYLHCCRFYHGYDNYMLYAFPHDELKPISKDFTDSLGKFFHHMPAMCQSIGTANKSSSYFSILWGSDDQSCTLT